MCAPWRSTGGARCPFILSTPIFVVCLCWLKGKVIIASCDFGDSYFSLLDCLLLGYKILNLIIYIYNLLLIGPMVAGLQRGCPLPLG